MLDEARVQGYAGLKQQLHNLFPELLREPKSRGELSIGRDLCCNYFQTFFSVPLEIFSHDHHQLY